MVRKKKSKKVRDKFFLHAEAVSTLYEEQSRLHRQQEAFVKPFAFLASYAFLPTYFFPVVHSIFNHIARIVMHYSSYTGVFGKLLVQYGWGVANPLDNPLFYQYFPWINDPYALKHVIIEAYSDFPEVGDSVQRLFNVYSERAIENQSYPVYDFLGWVDELMHDVGASFTLNGTEGSSFSFGEDAPDFHEFGIRAIASHLYFYLDHFLQMALVLVRIDSSVEGCEFKIPEIDFANSKLIPERTPSLTRFMEIIQGIFSCESDWFEHVYERLGEAAKINNIGDYLFEDNKEQFDSFFAFYASWGAFSLAAFLLPLLIVPLMAKLFPMRLLSSERDIFLKQDVSLKNPDELKVRSEVAKEISMKLYWPIIVARIAVIIFAVSEIKAWCETRNAKYAQTVSASFFIPIILGSLLSLLCGFYQQSIALSNMRRSLNQMEEFLPKDPGFKNNKKKFSSSLFSIRIMEGRDLESSFLAWFFYGEKQLSDLEIKKAMLGCFNLHDIRVINQIPGLPWCYTTVISDVAPEVFQSDFKMRCSMEIERKNFLSNLAEYSQLIKVHVLKNSDEWMFHIRFSESLEESERENTSAILNQQCKFQSGFFEVNSLKNINISMLKDALKTKQVEEFEHQSLFQLFKRRPVSQSKVSKNNGAGVGVSVGVNANASAIGAAPSWLLMGPDGKQFFVTTEIGAYDSDSHVCWVAVPMRNSEKRYHMLYPVNKDETLEEVMSRNDACTVASQLAQTHLDSQGVKETDHGTYEIKFLGANGKSDRIVPVYRIEGSHPPLFYLDREVYSMSNDELTQNPEYHHRHRRYGR